MHNRSRPVNLLTWKISLLLPRTNVAEAIEDLDESGSAVVKGVAEGCISSVSCWVPLMKVAKDFLNSGLSMDQSTGKCRAGSNELAREARLVRSVLVLDSIGVTKSIGLG